MNPATKLVAMTIATATAREWELHGVSMIFEPMAEKHRNVT